MNRDTQSYIDHFNISSSLEYMLDSLFASVAESATEEDIQYFDRLRAGFDIRALLEAKGAHLESLFSQEELAEIVVLYRDHPVLSKLLAHNEAIFDADRVAGERMVAEAAARIPYIVEAGVC